MAINADEDTEFNDALRKHGILPPKEPTPPSPSPPPSPELEDILDEFDLNELRELSETAPDDETERLIAQYRKQRITESKAEQRRARFGSVYPIGRDDYTREVTEASKINEEDDQDKNGTGVVCFLYKDGLPRSEIAFKHIRILSQRHPRTKFVSIVGDKCIADLPDSRVPMILAYRRGDIRQQIVAWGADRERRLEELEAILSVVGVLEVPKKPERKKGDSDDEGDDWDEDPSSRMRSATTSTNARSQKNIRSSQSKKDDDDSDFEFDL